MRRLAPMAVLLAHAACDDTQTADRAPSNMYVHVYVESGDSPGMDSTDTPLRASVSLEAQEGTTEVADTTGPDGVAIFLELPGGRYTISHEPTALPDGLERVGSHRQTVVAPLAGADSVFANFVYRDTVTAPAGARD
jgi:hypothetical protein